MTINVQMDPGWDSVLCHCMAKEDTAKLPDYGRDDVYARGYGRGEDQTANGYASCRLIFLASMTLVWCQRTKTADSARPCESGNGCGHGDGW